MLLHEHGTQFSNGSPDVLIAAVIALASDSCRVQKPGIQSLRLPRHSDHRTPFHSQLEIRAFAPQAETMFKVLDKVNCLSKSLYVIMAKMLILKSLKVATSLHL